MKLKREVYILYDKETDECGMASGYVSIFGTGREIDPLIELYDDQIIEVIKSKADAFKSSGLRLYKCEVALTEEVPT